MVSQASQDLPRAEAPAASHLRDYSELFRKLADEGFEFAVIGGCAVVADASLLGEDLFSADLDLPRARLAPARRLLGVLHSKVLPPALADRLLELADTPVDYRFLMGRVPTEVQAREILERMEKREAELYEQLAGIFEVRQFENT